MIAFKKSVTIWFGDAVSTLSLDEVARMTGTTPRNATKALDELEERGYLTRRPDGDYDATVPGGAA